MLQVICIANIELSYSQVVSQLSLVTRHALRTAAGGTAPPVWHTKKCYLLNITHSTSQSVITQHDQVTRGQGLLLPISRGEGRNNKQREGGTTQQPSSIDATRVLAQVIQPWPPDSSRV